MKLRSNRVWFVSVALTLLGFGLGTTNANAQTTYPFEAVYDTELILRPITSEIIEVTVTGENVDNPYSLTNIVSSNYGRLDPTTGVLTFSSEQS